MSKSKRTRSELIRFLRECSASELAGLCYEAFKDHPDNLDDELDQTRLVLGLMQRSLGDDRKWGPWHVHLVAPHDPAVYPLGTDGEAYSQYGTCPNCSVTLCCHVKDALCPLCSRRVGAT